MRNICFIALLTGSLLAACSVEKEEKALAPDEYSILVKVENPREGVSLQLFQINEQERKLIDSAGFNASDSTYRLSGKSPAADFALLKIGDMQEMLIYLEPGRINLQAEGNKPKAKYSIGGTRNNDYLDQLNTYQSEYAMAMAGFEQEYMMVQGSGAEQDMSVLEAKYKSLQASETDKLKQLINAMDSSPVAIYAAGMFYDKDASFPFLDSLSARLSSQMPKDKYALLFAEQMNKLRKFAIGQPAPDFTLTDLEGKSFSLTSLKGNYVLIDFWASWCKPCRQENPNVVATYKKFKGKPFKIIGVSLDRSEEPWREAIKADGLSWSHVWDKEGKVANDYAVEGIPSTFLLDKEGKIIAKNLRGGALENKLKEVM